MTFLIQSIDNKIVHDFSFELIRSVEYQREFNNKSDIGYMIRPMPYIQNTLIRNDSNHLIPIGTVEYVSLFLSRFHDIYVKPINIPPVLQDKKYAKRDVFTYDPISSSNRIPDNGNKYFIKHHMEIKHNTFPRIDYIKNINSDNGYDLSTYQISEFLDIKSEWRGFVHKNELLDIRRYSGDIDIFPDISYINKLINAYSNNGAPVAYTIDVGINDELGTFIIEVHDFFSCGLYGFSNYNKLPFMFSQWFHEKINK